MTKGEFLAEAKSECLKFLDLLDSIGAPDEITEYYINQFYGMVKYICKAHDCVDAYMETIEGFVSKEDIEKVKAMANEKMSEMELKFNRSGMPYEEHGNITVFPGVVWEKKKKNPEE